jgi:hypothetical protein
MLLTVAINGIGIIGKSFELPLPAETKTIWSKKSIVERLFSIFMNDKSDAKVCNNNSS